MNKTSHPLYQCWKDMKARCNNPFHRCFHHYGGRGIVVCDEWNQDFWMFVHHMGPKPTPKHSLGRVDNNHIYCPENCRWETPEQQNKNRREPFPVLFKPPVNPNKTNSGNPKLTLEQARNIKVKLAEGVKQSTLAKEFNVSVSAINQINTGRTWTKA